MSYDVWIENARGQDLFALGANYTYNVAPMFFHAVGSSPTRWDGKGAGEVAKLAIIALSAFGADPELYRAMNPPNGWGNFEGASEFLSDIYHACRAWSLHTFRCA